MNNTYSLEQISKTGKLDAYLSLHRYKRHLKARLMEMKSTNPKKIQKTNSTTLRFFRVNN